MNIELKSYISLPGVLVVFAMSLALLASCSLFSSKFEPQWNTNQTEPLIQATDCCGFVPQILPFNYIPSAQLWGDGTFIWTDHDQEGRRSVNQITLSQSEIGGLLKEFTQAGFFTWLDEYADHRIADIPWTCIHIALASKSKSVCEYYQGAPSAFDTLFERLADGLGKTGEAYWPTRGFMTSYSIEGIGFSDQAATPWPTSVGVSLAGAAQGIWIEGEALRVAWEIVNESTWGNWLESDSKIYQLTLQVPGLSMIEPEQFE